MSGTVKALDLKDFITFENNRYYISTIQMEVRHSWQKEHEKICVFETMVFAAPEGEIDYHSSLYHRRYRTLDGAIKGHADTIGALPQIILTCKACPNRH